jgi:hypothetical protein
MIFGWLTPIFTLLAFILLLLSTLSTPIIKGIYLYAIPDRNVRLGLWGYCTSAVSGRFVDRRPEAVLVLMLSQRWILLGQAFRIHPRPEPGQRTVSPPVIFVYSFLLK